MPAEISIGGIETITLSLWKELLKMGAGVDFVCHGYSKGLFEDEILSKGSNVFHIPVKSNNYYKAINDYKIILKAKHYDVVHANMNSTCGIYLKIAKQFGVKTLIAHSHCSSMKAFTTNPIKAAINNLEKIKTNKYANVKLACSKSAGKWLFGNRDFIVVNNGIDLNKFKINNEVRKEYRDKIGYCSNDKVIGHVGRFSYEKNHRFIIDLFAEIRKESTDYKLLLLGDGELKPEIEEYAKSKGVYDVITFTGNVSNVQDYMQAMDLFILPSLSEGLPLTGVEAQACGLPVIFSSGVPNEAKLTDNVVFISIYDLPVWKSEVKRMTLLPRVDTSEIIQATGYDISQTIDLITNILIHY